MRVPREIDELMWAVAEDGRETTVEQFNARYPQFGGELEKRRQMVDSLKGSRPAQAETARFVPRQQVRNFGPSRLAVAGIAALVLASVTFATYATMQIVNGKRSAPVPVESPEIIFNPPDFGNEPTPVHPDGRDEPLAVNDVQPLQEQPDMEDVYMGLITVQADDTSLEKAIRDMVMQAGLDVTIAPGFEDKRIRISFVRQPLYSVLQDLGRHFGFTAFKQGKTEILIVPAVDGRVSNEAGVPGSTGPAKAGEKGVDDAGTTGGGAPDEDNAPLTWPLGG